MGNEESTPNTNERIEFDIKDARPDVKFEAPNTREALINKAKEVAIEVARLFPFKPNEKILWEFELYGSHPAEDWMFWDRKKQIEDSWDDKPDIRAEELDLLEQESKGLLYLQAYMVDKDTGEKLGTWVSNTRIFLDAYIEKNKGKVNKDEFVQAIIDMLKNRKL